MSASGLGASRRDPVGRFQQAVGPGQDGRQAGFGGDFHRRVLAQAIAALLPDHAGVVPGQQFPLRCHEGTAALRRVAQGADGPAGGLVGVGDYQGEEGPLLCIGRCSMLRSR